MFKQVSTVFSLWRHIAFLEKSEDTDVKLYTMVCHGSIKGS